MFDTGSKIWTDSEPSEPASTNNLLVFGSMFTVLHSASSGSCVDLKVDSFVSELTVYNHPLLFLLKFVFNQCKIWMEL